MPAGPVANFNFTLVLAQARSNAKALFGPPASDLLPQIDFAAIARAFSAALLAGLTGNERNVLQTLARMIVTLETGAFVTRDVAATHIAPRIPDDPAKLPVMAAQADRGEVKDDWAGRCQEVAALATALARHIRR